MKVVLRKKMRKFKRKGLGKRDLRRLTVYMDGKKQCNCPLLDDLERAKKSSYLLMGHKSNDSRITGSLLLPWNKENVNFKRAARKFKKLDCSKETKFVVEKTIGMHADKNGRDKSRTAETISADDDKTAERQNRKRGRSEDEKRKRRRERKKAARKNKNLSKNGRNSEELPLEMPPDTASVE